VAQPSSDEPLPASESDSNPTQLQSSTKLPSAAQSKQRLIALLTRSQQPTNSATPKVQSNNKARMYRQELINRLLKSR
jgi:hypothetical protein